MLEVGESVERYRVEAVLGGGGLAMVYRVRHLQLGTVHALKVLMVTMPTDRARLMAEGQVQARLSHPNVVGVSDVFLVHRAPALLMELVDGPSLEQALARGPMPVDRALTLFRGIVTGVGAAHAAGLVHRDLKPSNVLLGRGYGAEPVPKVTDFGLVRLVAAGARHTTAGASIGTPAYMAPEQVRDPSGVDARADLWALGCILYELLCNRRAFDADDPFTLFAAIATGSYEDPETFAPQAPIRALDAIRALLVPDRNARIPSCAALWARLWEDEPVPVELQATVALALDESAPLDAGPPRRAPTPVRRARWPWFAAPLAIAVLAGIAGLLLLRPDPEPRLESPPEPAPVPVAEPPPPIAPPDPEPEPAPEPPRPVRLEGRVNVEGDATEVWLVAGDRRLPAPGAVPPGRYVVRATWTDGVERTAGRVEIRAGAETTVRCASFVLACTTVEAPRPAAPSGP